VGFGGYIASPTSNLSAIIAPDLAEVSVRILQGVGFGHFPGNRDNREFQLFGMYFRCRIGQNAL
jgi:hypothetical protein